MDGLNFVVNARSEYRLAMFGRHNVFNALLAMGVARRFGLTDEEIAAGISAIKPPSMRMEPQRLGSHFVLNDAYNANPTSMARRWKHSPVCRLIIPADSRRCAVSPYSVICSN